MPTSKQHASNQTADQARTTAFATRLITPAAPRTP